MAIILFTITNTMHKTIGFGREKPSTKKVDLAQKWKLQNVSLGIEQLNIIKKNEKPNPIPNFNIFLHKL